MAGPIGAVDTALYNKLNIPAITALLGGQSRIYKSIAPGGATLPYVIYAHDSGGDENETPTRNREVVYSVKAIAATASGAEQIDEQLDLALHHQTLSITGWTNFWMAREDDVVSADASTHTVGGKYRIRISKNP